MPAGDQRQTTDSELTAGLFAGPPTLAGGGGWAGLLQPAAGPGELGRLGPYRVLKELGRGGMGVVFLADDPGLDRRIALKTLLPGADPETVARFAREARALAAVDSDHVVAVHQVGEAGGVPYLAMPLLQGVTLAAALAASRLTPTEVIRIGAEVADGLAAAHERGLVHRDVKPANIWLEVGRRRVKLIDFGLARAGDRPDPPTPDTPPPAAAAAVDPLTAFGTAVGTPAYMSPEQAAGRPVDPRSDLFSLGCVLYHAATGVMPFAGPDPLAVMTAVRTTTPPPASAVLRSVPPGLSGLIARLMARDPADRPASAAAVAAELRRLAGPPRRRRAGRLLAAVVAVVALAGAAVLVRWLDRRPADHHGAANRATDLALRHGGAVRLPDGRLRRGHHELPPPPHAPTEIAVRGVPRRDWPELITCLGHTVSLCRLEVADCPLTDAELAALAYAPLGGRLEELSVTGCPQVTAHGLTAVARMTGLRRLTLDAAGPAADAAVRSLAGALPGCRIEWPGGAVGPAAE